MKEFTKKEIADNFETAKNYYFDNGYLIVKNVLGHDFIDQLNNSLGIYTGRKQDEWKTNPNVKKVACNQYIKNLLTKLYNDDPLPFQTLNFIYGTTQSEHTDLVHFCPSEENLELMCGVWYALEDITDEKGPLIFYPKSHKEKYLLDLEEIGGYGNYTQHIKKFAQSKFTRTNGNIKKGSVIIWCSNLIHGGHPERNKELTRKSMVTHYFFKSSKYYWTPKSSTKKKKVYRNNILSITKSITG